MCGSEDIGDIQAAATRGFRDVGIDRRAVTIAGKRDAGRITGNAISGAKDAGAGDN
jgi:hypothetical protein